MSEPMRVFVSHHHSPGEDGLTARLVAHLEATGADVWVDDACITSDDFIKKINERLTGRQWLVLVMTPGGCARNGCARRWTRRCSRCGRDACWERFPW
jgi:hypothetical protein